MRKEVRRTTLFASLEKGLVSGSLSLDRAAGINYLLVDIYHDGVVNVCESERLYYLEMAMRDYEWARSINEQIAKRSSER